MIHYQLGQDILNRLLLTSGSTGVTREEDLQNMLNSKFVMCDAHDDFGGTKSEYAGCAFFELKGTKKVLKKGKAAGVNQEPTNDTIDDYDGVDKYPGDWVKIPIVQIDTGGDKLAIGIKTKDYYNAIQTKVKEENTGLNANDGETFVSFEVSESNLQTGLKQILKGLENLLKTSSFFVPPQQKKSGETKITFAYPVLVLESKPEEWTETKGSSTSEREKDVDRAKVGQAIIADDADPIEEPEYYYYEQVAVQTKVFPQKAYIGLFTTNPLADGTGFVEPTSYFKDSSMTYRRMNLHEGLFSGEYVFNNLIPAAKGTKIGTSDTAKDVEGYAELSNKEIIMFPEVLTQSWGVIEGFGIFENEYPPEDEEEAKNEHPYFWGEVSNPREASVGTVPLFRADEFKIYLG